MKKICGRVLNMNKLQNIEAGLMIIEGDIKDVQKKITPLQESLNVLWETKKNLEKQFDELTIKSFKKPDWNYILFENGMVNNARYKYRGEQINKIGLSNSCFFQDTQQVQIKVTLTNGNLKQLKQTKKALEKVLPYIKFTKNGYKRIGIMERSCSANGIYELFVSKGIQYLINKITYGREEILKRYNTLDEALQYIYDHLYYNRVDAKGEEIDENNY